MVAGKSVLNCLVDGELFPHTQVEKQAWCARDHQVKGINL